jgi:hypothetical protein
LTDVSLCVPCGLDQSAGPQVVSDGVLRYEPFFVVFISDLLRSVQACDHGRRAIAIVRRRNMFDKFSIVNTVEAEEHLIGAFDPKKLAILTASNRISACPCPPGSLGDAYVLRIFSRKFVSKHHRLISERAKASAWEAYLLFLVNL